MAKMTINGQTFEGSVDELVELRKKIGAEISDVRIYGIDFAKGIRNVVSGDGKSYSPIKATQFGQELIETFKTKTFEVKPETITHEGVEYRRVDREAREGDVVVVRETEDCDLTVGKAYVVTENLGGSDAGVIDDIGENNAVLNDSEKFDVYEPIFAKPAPLQVGDYAKVVAHNNDNCFGGAVGDVVKVIHVSNERYSVEELDGGSYGGNPNAKKEALVRATDEEVAEAKRQQAEMAVADKWAEIGRKPNEFKVGDAVQYKKAFTTVSYVGPKYIRIRQSSNVENNIAVNPANLTLVFPVESKFGGDSE